MKKLLLVLLVSSCIAFFTIVEGYDAYKVSAIYPRGFCYFPRGASSACIYDYRTQGYYMIIHGVWPVNTTNPPSIAPPPERSEAFDLASLSSRVQRSLVAIWPNFIRGSTYIIFWTKEWERHGKYSCFLPQRYFQECFNIWDRVKIDIRIAHAGLFPCRSQIRIAQFKSQLAAELGGIEPQVTCTGTPTNHILSEIRFCVDTTFHFVSCGVTTVKNDPSCGQDESFIYAP